MKKNVMMRLAAILLVCVLASTCGISGTYAKYVTSDSAFDTARVAKWGVHVEADFSTLFTSTYKTHNTWTGDDAGLKSVVAYNGTDNLVAPGTDGDLAQFDIGGTPEVDVNVSYTADLVLTGWYVDHDNDPDTDKIEYCPLVITVNGTSFAIDNVNIKTVAELEAAVEKAIRETAKNYNANTNLAEVEDDLSVSWDWYFVGNNEGGYGPDCQFDVLDTKLGDEAAADNAATIKLEVECIITQID